MASVKKYVWLKPDGKWTKPHGLTSARLVASKRIVWGKGPYTIKRDGNVIRKDLTKTQAVNIVVHQVKTTEVGSTFRVWDSKGSIRFTVRAVKIKLPPPLPTNSTNGNSKADAYYNWVVSNYKQYGPNYAGSYVCRSIAGTWTASQHSYGNAVDFFFNSLVHQDMVANAVVSNASKLDVEHVISRQRVWTRGQGWHTYTGDYHSHLHVDFNPNLSGYCGVRG